MKRFRRRGGEFSALETALRAERPQPGADLERDIAERLVIDLGSGTVFGRYPGGTAIKYAQAPGGSPNEKTIGSMTGRAGAVSTHITGTGDFQIVPVDGGPTQTCLVPPPPK
jgi:hypothetical protein